MSWIKLLAYITGSVDQELLLRNEYLVAENRILRGQITGRVQLNDGERKTLADIGKKLGKKALEEVAHIVRPETIVPPENSSQLNLFIFYSRTHLVSHQELSSSQ